MASSTKLIGDVKFLFTGHFRDRQVERQIPLDLVFDAAAFGGRKQLKGKPWQQLCFGEDVVVCLEDGWKIVTAWWAVPYEAGGRAKRRWLRENQKNSGSVA